MDDMSADGTRHDPETIARGLSKVAEIRAQLAERNPNMRRRRATEAGPPRAPSPPARPIVNEHTILDEWSPDKISAEMAAGSERDQLQARVDRLESEVSQLRSALAAVLTAASTELHAPSESPLDVESSSAGSTNRREEHSAAHSTSDLEPSPSAERVP